MKLSTTLSLLVFLLLTTSLEAQQQPQTYISWKDYSDTTFVFEISNKEAEKFLTKGNGSDEFMQEILHTKVAAFTDKWENKPERGHFIYANIHKNKIDFRYAPVIPFQVFLFKEYGQLTLQVIDSKGEIRHDAKVRIQSNGWRIFDTTVDFDKTSKTYTIDDWSEKQQRILTVELEKFKAVFDLNKYFVSARYNNHWNNDEGPDFYSYMITDKNKYKPGEKVRFKSYALTGRKRPIKDNLEVWMTKPNSTSYYSSSYKKITDIKPYNPGGFAGEMELHDSLELRLDYNYYVQLRDKRGRIVANTNFRYEDYELYDSKMESKLSLSTHYFPDTNYVEIKVIDANGLIIPDMKSVITIMRENISQTYDELTVLPYFVRCDTIQLDNDKDTRYYIPPDLMGNVDGNYSVNISSITPDGKNFNARHQSTFYKSHYSIRHNVTDSIINFEFFDLGKAKQVDAQLYIDGAETPVAIQLPHSEPFVQSVKEYRIYVPEFGTSAHINNSNIPNGLNIEGDIVKDSLKLTMANPRGLEVSWYIYEGNILLEKGFGKEMTFEREHINLDISYFLEIFYTIGGQDMVYRKIYSPKKEFLNVDVDLPDRIYPGQNVNATVKVTDSRGLNVKDVDLTAFSFNTQLNYYVPDLPYYGNTPKGREQRNSYNINRRSVAYSSYLTQKNYAFWNNIMSLDKMNYYRFIFPNPKLHEDSNDYTPHYLHGLPHHDLFKYTVDTPDGTTEFAPYVMVDGKQVTIHVIELGDIPVYFNWTNQPKGYSFLTESNRFHKIMLRLHDRAIIIDNYCFDEGKKTILSINLNNMPQSKHVRTVMLDTRNRSNNYNYQLTTNEQNKYQSYISELPVDDARYIYLQRDSVRYPVFYPGLTKYNNKVLVGPLRQGTYQYMDGIKYYHEGNFSYKYSGNVVYKYCTNVFPTILTNNHDNEFRQLNDFHFTPEEFARRIGDRPTETNKWFPDIINLSNTKIHVPEDKDRTGVHSLIMRSRETGKLFVPAHKQRIVGLSSRYGDSQSLFGMDKMEYGNYDIFLLYNSGKYIRYNDVPLLKNTYTELKMNHCEEQPKDSVSSKWLEYEIYTSQNQYDYSHSYTSTSSTFTSRQTQYTVKSAFNPVNDIRGIITDTEGEAIIGASISIKGQNVGTISDINGEFVLDLHGQKNIIVIAFIGYITQEITTTRGSTITVVIKEDNRILEEVVVVGYGTQRRSDVTGALSGRMAGVDVSNTQPSSAPEEKVEESDDEDDEATAEDKLYQELMNLNGLRTNFSDVGFWEPALVTNRKGEASFMVTFPDNITSWQAVVYAMNRRLKTGTARKTIQSYKPLMAELKMPSFMVVGDSSYFAANIRNYTKDPEINGCVDFVNNGDTLRQTVNFTSSRQDYPLVIAPEADSLTVSYLFTRDDGYSDGEQRSISIEKQGTEIAEGSLQFLRNGNEINVSAQPDEAVHISITGKQVDIYMDAANYLRGYRYACNEQLASKLIGLLNYRLYVQFMGEKFKHDKEVNELIDRLLKNQNNIQLWSWWGNSSGTSYWMSAHILRALYLAKQSGYTVNLNIKNITYDYKDIHTFRNTPLSDIDILSALVDWGTEQNYEAAIQLFDNIIAHKEAEQDSLVNIYKKTKLRKDYAVKRSYLREKLLLLEMRQKLDLEYNRELITSHLETDVLGSVRMVDTLANNYWYYNNDVANLIAYRIVRNDSVLKHNQDGMQMHILGTKRYGWNTYQASSALMTVLPDLLSESASKDQLAKVNLSGKENRALTEFPYTTILQGGEQLNIKKESGIPLIYSAYTIQRRTNEHFGDAFEIKTTISESTLKKGNPVKMIVEVTVKQDNAEHVMIEVPIPAGCSYNSKTRGYYGNYEVYREHFKEKTVIFCERLPKGQHTYYIDLLPRYSGSYIVNPAKVEMMYFPVINANNDLRKIGIE